jgi:hypothetical protein
METPPLTQVRSLPRAGAREAEPNTRFVPPNAALQPCCCRMLLSGATAVGGETGKWWHRVYFRINTQKFTRESLPASFGARGSAVVKALHPSKIHVPTSWSSFPYGFPASSSPPFVLHARPSHPLRLDHSNYAWRRVEITKLLVMQFPSHTLLNGKSLYDRPPIDGRTSARTKLRTTDLQGA